MQVVSVSLKDEVGLWIEKGYNLLLQKFQYELSKEEQAIFLWNAHVLLSKLLEKRSWSG